MLVVDSDEELPPKRLLKRSVMPPMMLNSNPITYLRMILVMIFTTPRIAIPRKLDLLESSLIPVNISLIFEPKLPISSPIKIIILVGPFMDVSYTF